MKKGLGTVRFLPMFPVMPQCRPSSLERPLFQGEAIVIKVGIDCPAGLEGQ